MLGNGPYSNNFNGSSRGVARARQASVEENRLNADYYTSGKNGGLGEHQSSSSDNLEGVGMKYGRGLGNENHAS